MLEDIREDQILEKGRIHPGKMLVVDTIGQRIINDDELKEYYAKRQPYGEWLDQHMVELKDLKIPNRKVEQYTTEECAKLRKALDILMRNIMIPSGPWH